MDPPRSASSSAFKVTRASAGVAPRVAAAPPGDPRWRSPRNATSDGRKCADTELPARRVGLPHPSLTMVVLPRRRAPANPSPSAARQDPEALADRAGDDRAPRLLPLPYERTVSIRTGALRSSREVRPSPGREGVRNGQPAAAPGSGSRRSSCARIRPTLDRLPEPPFTVPGWSACGRHEGSARPPRCGPEARPRRRDHAATNWSGLFRRRDDDRGISAPASGVVTPGVRRRAAG